VYIKAHKDVEAGSIHAPHNLEYTNAADRIAGTNEVSGIVLSSDNVGQVACQTDVPSYWVLTNHSPILWQHILTGSRLTVLGYTNLYVEIAKGGFYVRQYPPLRLEDDEYIDLPTNTYGFGRFILTSGGATQEYAEIAWSLNGVPEFVGSPSTNAVLANTDTKFAIFDNGTNVRVRNRLGSWKYLTNEYFFGAKI